LIAAAILIQGCGGSPGGGGTTTTGSAPTATTKANIALHLGSFGRAVAGTSFTTFGSGSTSSGPFYSSRLQLWVVESVSGTTFTETFYQDQAETEPAGSATYTLNLSTKTLSGAISITEGPYAGLSGTYSQAVVSNGTAGNYQFTLPSGTTVSSQFTVVVVGINVTGSGTETITQPGGYSETAAVTYNANHTIKIVASDTNGYSGTFNVAADYSGTGTINGPDPGLPAKVVWNSGGTGTVTFSDGLTLNFTDWQFAQAPLR